MQELPAQKAIRLFGLPALAKLVNRSEVQVRRWGYAKDKGGYDGQIPARFHRALIEAAREKDLAFTAEDCIPWLGTGGEAA